MGVGQHPEDGRELVEYPRPGVLHGALQRVQEEEEDADAEDGTADEDGDHDVVKGEIYVHLGLGDCLPRAVVYAAHDPAPVFQEAEGECRHGFI